MVGRVNCYLIEDDPLTLVDTGPNSGKALDCLERELAAHGRRIEDLGRIVITHQHLDHLGLVDVLARRSRRRGRRARPAGAADRGLRRRGRARRRAGRGADAAPRDHARRGHRAARGVALVPRLGRLGDRDAAAGRRRGAGVRRPHAGALHRPGHSPSDTIFLDEADGTLLAGDHLLRHISSNPLISRQLGGKSGEPGDGRPRALLTYLASLRETREMEISEVLPGPRRPVRRPRGADRRALRDARAARAQDPRAARASSR